MLDWLLHINITATLEWNMVNSNRIHPNLSRQTTRLLTFAVLVLLVILFAACAAQPVTPETTSPAVTVTLIPDHAGVEGDTLTVQLSDANGQPLIGAQVSIEGNMTHAGMVPMVSDPVADDADGAADGSYAVPFQFSMLGDWIITVSATLADGSTASQEIPVTVTESGVAVTGAEQAGLHVMDARARPSPMAAGNGAVFLTIVNPTAAPDRSVSVSSPVAAAAEIHETVDDNGVMRMVPQPDGFEIPAHGAVELAPGGKHIMLLNLTQQLQPGQEIEVTLTFEYAPPISLTVPVVEMDEAMPEHSSP